MEIEDDPDIRKASKELELEQIRFQKKLAEKDNVVTMFKKVTRYDASGVPPQYVPLFLEWQNREAAAALGMDSVQQPKPVPMQQHNVDEDEEMEMEMDDGNEEQSAGAPPQPSGAAPPINVDDMITVDIVLKENNIVVTKQQAQRVGNITSDVDKEKFPNELRYKKSVKSSPYEHRHYPRSHACIIMEAYKTMMKEEEEKAARQPPPAPAKKPAPPTQEDLNRFLNGGKR
jgi:hypothetical protein